VVFINYSTKEISVKIVYYGPGLSGKTTNLQYIYKKTDKSFRGELVSLDTDTERTLFFDFLPINIGKINGLNLRTHLYSVPGQVFYDASRRLILKGVDGIVFVVDSQEERMDANIESFDNLKKNLLMNSVIFENIPLIIQYNKTDLSNAMPIEEMHKLFNPENKYPEYKACASCGKGVFETFKHIVRLIIRKNAFIKK